MSGSLGLMPHDQVAERAVLGAVFIENKCLDVISGMIDETDFYTDAYRQVFAVMRDFRQRGMGIDHVTVGSELHAKGILEKIGGAMVLSDLTDAVATTANVEHYARIVHERSAMRSVIVAAREIALKSYPGNDSDGVEGAFDTLQDSMHRLSRTRMPTSLLSLGDSVLEDYDRVAHGYSGVPLPWPTLNAITSGMWPKTLTMFVARPGTGKTMVAVIAARHAWMQGNRVLIISPEMSRAEIAERFFSIHSLVSYQRIVNGTVSDFEMPKLQSTINECKAQEGLWIMDSDDDITPRGIDGAIRACRPALLAIDSLYDLRIRGERRDKLLVALDWFKGAVKRFDMAGLGFVQLNRSAEVSEKKGGGVRLGTIALADEIGQDSHAVYALEQDKDMRDDKRLRFKPLKMRRGSSSGKGIEVHWDFSNMEFSEIETDDNSFEDDAIPF
jgi:replicative DNA helicase